MGRSCSWADRIRTFQKIRSSRRQMLLRVLALVLCGAGCQPAADCQSAPYTPPKTAWGDPDLQGMWPGELRAPMQRPVDLGTRTTLTDEEYAQREAQSKKQAQVDSEEFAKGSATVTINPPSYWTERGTPSRQTSLIVDPPNGRLPAMTPEGKKLVTETPA